MPARAKRKYTAPVNAIMTSCHFDEGSPIIVVMLGDGQKVSIELSNPQMDMLVKDFAKHKQKRTK